MPINHNLSRRKHIQQKKKKKKIKKVDVSMSPIEFHAIIKDSSFFCWKNISSLFTLQHSNGQYYLFRWLQYYWDNTFYKFEHT
jgi:hypothetical protein